MVVGTQEEDPVACCVPLASEARATYDTYPSSGKGEHSSKADHCECLEKVRDEEWEVFLAWRLLPCLFVCQ
jgi:hypothetical protein